MIAIAFHFAVKEPGKEFTALQVADSLGVSKNTARGYLKKLVEEDLLVLASTKRVRTVRYLAPANLREYSVSQINKVHLTTCGNPLRGFDDGWSVEDAPRACSGENGRSLFRRSPNGDALQGMLAGSL